MDPGSRHIRPCNPKPGHISKPETDSKPENWSHLASEIETWMLKKYSISGKGRGSCRREEEEEEQDKRGKSATKGYVYPQGSRVGAVYECSAV